MFSDAFLGRSHRAPAGKERLRRIIEESRKILGIPEDYRIGIVPASDTGAMEMALWSLLGARGVDVLAWENFGKTWAVDIRDHLRIEDVRLFEAAYGAFPDLSGVDCDRDVVFAWNGTTSGVCVPDGAWIDPGRKGLIICDATSALFCMDVPWDRLDVVTWSWQKGLGGEAAHGMLAFSPRAIERLEAYVPPWPLPKIFRLAPGGSLIEGVFFGETLNTPSMLCVQDCLDGLAWARGIGGLPALLKRSQESFKALEQWVSARDWISFLASDPATRSCSSVCLTIPENSGFTESERADIPAAIAERLAEENVAYDIKGHRAAPSCLRIWTGPTVEPDDVAALIPWLDWAFEVDRADAGVRPKAKAESC